MRKASTLNGYLELIFVFFTPEDFLKGQSIGYAAAWFISLCFAHPYDIDRHEALHCNHST